MNRRTQRGVALLLVVVAITLLSVVLLEFSMRSRLHLQAGANMRHQVRATTAADTALVLTRACLDPEAWGTLSAFQDKVDLETLCGMMPAFSPVRDLICPSAACHLNYRVFKESGSATVKLSSR